MAGGSGLDSFTVNFYKTISDNKIQNIQIVSISFNYLPKHAESGK